MKRLLPALAILLGAIALFLVWNSTRTVSFGDTKTDRSGDQVMCTQDAMQCPDGHYVGRTGPNCEFKC